MNSNEDLMTACAAVFAAFCCALATCAVLYLPTGAWLFLMLPSVFLGGIAAAITYFVVVWRFGRRGHVGRREGAIIGAVVGTLLGLAPLLLLLFPIASLCGPCP